MPILAIELGQSLEEALRVGRLRRWAIGQRCGVLSETTTYGQSCAGEEYYQAACPTPREHRLLTRSTAGQIGHEQLTSAPAQDINVALAEKVGKSLQLVCSRHQVVALWL
jgi:hypothetical protein